MLSVREFEDELLVEISHRFFEEPGESTREIANAINKEWELEKPLTREQIYPLLREARRRRFFTLLPPLHSALREAVAKKYELPNHRLHVAPVRGNGALEIVAEKAADVIMGLIRDVAQKKDRVHIGLGAGGTMTQVAPRLASRLRSEAELPQLALHALSSGFNVERPHTAPVSFFSAFHGVAPDIKYFGLFAPAVVEKDNYKREIGRRGVVESFDRAADIDIIVSALAWSEDPDGELRHYIEDARDLEQMGRDGWIGDVLYQPFSAFGPLPEKAKMKAVSLFTLAQLAERARTPGKHVVLVAGPCAYCGERKGPALRPLLSSPELRVWSEVIMDIQTAEQLLTPAATKPPTRARKR